jgi:hypothetical protein
MKASAPIAVGCLAASGSTGSTRDAEGLGDEVGVLDVVEPAAVPVNRLPVGRLPPEPEVHPETATTAATTTHRLRSIPELITRKP